MASVIPVRSMPNDKSELVTQILFGETFTLLDKRGENWICIKCSWDDYVGWIDEKMITYIDEEAFHRYSGPQPCALELSHSVSAKDHSYPILIGSSLPGYDGMSFNVNKDKYIYTGQVVSDLEENKQADFIEKFALKYLHAPYLWGGRNPFGIDCSGLVQVVYKLAGISLPRDAKDQVHKGQPIHFIETARKGDLAYFENEEGSIIHVGILLDNHKIIHASGQVRIDNIDHYGIYQINRRKYSHKLRMVKRVLQETGF